MPEVLPVTRQIFPCRWLSVMFAHASPYARIPEAFSSPCSPRSSSEDTSFQESRIGAGGRRVSSLLIACSLSEGSGHLLNSRILSNRANSKVFFDRVGFPPDLA